MSEDSLITQELRNKIGIESEPEEYEIEKGRLQQFVQAVGDPNPLWQDKEYARKKGYSGMIAPPTFIPIIGFGQGQHVLTEGSLHGSTELECFQPVKVGDKITVTNKLVDVRERRGSGMGKTVFITFERTYKNQRQELVAKCRQMFISYEVKAKHD